jgi:uncharacterized protein YycO
MPIAFSTSRSAFLLALPLSVACGHAHQEASTGSVDKTTAVAFLPGDLVFQSSTGSGVAAAIEAVTNGVDGRDFSHVGMVVEHADTLAIIEAIGAGVQLTGIAAFYERGVEVTVGRIRPEYRAIAELAAIEAMTHLGAPYDMAYLPDNGMLYCSELVALAYQSANGGVPVFEQEPMSFKDPATGEFLPSWVEYYAKLGVPIPEGVPGCNPGGLSRSPILIQ